MSGQILDVPKAPLSIQDKEASLLSEARHSLYKSSVRESGSIRTTLSPALKRMVKGVKQGMLRDGTGIKSQFLQRTTQQMKKLVTQAMDKTNELIIEGVKRSVGRATRAQQKHLESLGFKALKPSEMNKIREDAMETVLRERFKGKTYSERMGLIEREHKSHLEKLLRRKYQKDGEKKIAHDIRMGVAGKGRTRVSGGSLMNKLRRINVAEETRAANLAEVKLLEKSGVAYARWKLSPAHKWYGGTEICEWHAYRIDLTVVNELRAIGVDVSEPEMHGVFAVDRWPDFPHPHCKCFPEAWFPPEYKRAVEAIAKKSPRA